MSLKYEPASVPQVLRYEFMTIVQQQSCPVGLTGIDILAKAKTGESRINTD